MLDSGMKANILRNILKRGYKVIRVPYDFDFNNTDLKFDGVFLSNGPGDPALLQDVIERIKIAMKKGIPIVGICLGVQLLSIAAGAKTYKLKYGHRSQNQPCINLETGNCVLTSQNHGFAVDEKTLPKEYKVWFRNANDDSVEGVKHKTKPYAAVQFHPESDPGPTDTNYIFDELLQLI
jgi:carbamoyl-phosphate synthase small subunit